MEIPQTDPQMYGNLVNDKCGIADPWGEEQMGQVVGYPYTKLKTGSLLHNTHKNQLLID